jgi:hypothetical protein
MSTPYFHDTPEIVIAATRWPGPVNTNVTPALTRESDGCKARRAGKGHPLPSGATPQTRFLTATRRDGADSGASLCREPLAVNDTAARSASRAASRIGLVAGVTLVLTGPLRRYQQTGCRKLARMVEQHLRWMESHASNPQLADACQRLLFDWRTVSAPPRAINAAPQPTVH